MDRIRDSHGNSWLVGHFSSPEGFCYLNLKRAVDIGVSPSDIIAAAVQARKQAEGVGTELGQGLIEQRQLLLGGAAFAALAG